MAEAWSAPPSLRPFERCVLRLHAEGCDHGEIGRRFRKSPSTIARVLALASAPRPAVAVGPATAVLRPVERRVLRWLDAGVDHAEIGHRFRRHPDHIRRVQGYALLKLNDADALG